MNIFPLTCQVKTLSLRHYTSLNNNIYAHKKTAQISNRYGRINIGKR